MYGIDSYGYNGNPNLETEDLDSYEIGYRNNGFDVALFYIEESIHNIPVLCECSRRWRKQRC